MQRPKIGDLICYNGAGMKHKTLGIVMDVGRPDSFNHTPISYLIMWSVVGEIMPRKNRHTPELLKIEPNMLIWHEAGPWIEVVQ